MNEQKEKVRSLIKELKAEIRENRQDIKSYTKTHEFYEAARLLAINEALEYVILRMTSGSTALI